MKKLLLFFIMISVPLTASAKVKVVTTIPDLAALTQEVGKELVEVKSLARGDQDPHYLEPKPSFVVTVNQADLLIDVGLQLEIGWLPVLLTQSRNPRIQRGQNGYLNASEGIRPLEIPTGPVDRSMGDVHPEGNPHYWLNPKNGLIIAEKISERLALLDPPNAPTYRQNYQTFATAFLQKIRQWEQELKPFTGKKVITHHKSFSYFVDWSGLMVRNYIEPKPGIPPSPAHLLSLIELITTEKIPLLITENYYDPKSSQELAKKTGAKVLVLPTSVGGEKGVDSYEALFDHLIARLREARLGEVL